MIIHLHICAHRLPSWACKSEHTSESHLLRSEALLRAKIALAGDAGGNTQTSTTLAGMLGLARRRRQKMRTDVEMEVRQSSTLGPEFCLFVLPACASYGYSDPPPASGALSASTKPQSSGPSVEL